MQISCTWLSIDRNRVKLCTQGTSGTYEHDCNVDFTMLNVFFFFLGGGHLVHLRFFGKYNFHNADSSTRMIVFQSISFISVSCDS